MKSFIFLCLFSIFYSQSISIPYTTRIVTKQMEIPIRYAHRPVGLNIDLTMPFTWTCVANTDMTDLWDKPVYPITVEDQNVTAYNLTYDLFFTKNTKEQEKININLYLIDIKSRVDLTIGAWGLGYVQKEDKYSLMHQLKEKGIIEHKKFGLEARTKNEGIFHLGGMPMELTNKYYKTSCKVNEATSKSNWGCQLNEISFTNSQGKELAYPNINSNTISYFNTYTNNINAPLSFLEFMRDDLLKEYIDSEDKKCIYRSDGFAFNYITCK